MEKLPKEIYNSILLKLEAGDQKAKFDHLEEALSFYFNALKLIPEPKNNWKVTLQVVVAIADCYFNLENWNQANDYYNQALFCPDGVSSGYVWLGLGQSYFEIGNLEKAIDCLMSAYMLEGKDIFEDQDGKYFNIIKEFVLL